MVQFIKPPLGIMPKWRWLEIRGHELSLAISRYIDAGQTDTPELIKWIEELKTIPEKVNALKDWKYKL